MQGHALVTLMETNNADMCLERKHVHSATSPVSIGKCSKAGTKKWSISRDR